MRIKRMVKYYIAWVVVYMIEIAIAAAPAMAFAAFLLPHMASVRGEVAFGGEWILLALVFVLAFYWIDRKMISLIYDR